MEKETKERIMAITPIIIILFLLIILTPVKYIFLFPFEVSGNYENECFVSKSVSLTNRTQDWIWDLPNDKCCTYSNQWDGYPKYKFYCVE